MVELVVVGNFSKDLIYKGESFFESIGGTPFYTGLTASKLGVKTGVVANLGLNLRNYLSFLEELNLSGLRLMEESTVFEHHYLKGKRVSKIVCTGKPLSFNQIPKSFLEAEIIHLGPIFQEVTLEMIEKIRRKFKGVISLDAQGLTRFLNKEKEIFLKGDLCLKAVKHVDIIKLSIEEAKLFHENPEITCSMFLREGVRICIVTLGKEGVFVLTSKEEIKLPGVEVKEVVDETGAGDVFMGGMLYSMLKGKSLQDSLLTGEAAAAASLKDKGLKAIPNKKEIEEIYARKLRRLLKL